MVVRPRAVEGLRLLAGDAATDYSSGSDQASSEEHEGAGLRNWGGGGRGDGEVSGLGDISICIEELYGVVAGAIGYGIAGYALIPVDSAEGQDQ